MIPVLKPTADERTKKELLEVIDSGWWGQGAKTAEFEKEFAKYTGFKYAIALNSGTAALDLALKVYDIKGGELITTPMTFVADAIVGEWNGMDVTFADIDGNSLCIDPKAVRITEDTKAIIAVNSHGRLADIEGLRKKFKGLIIEDCAHCGGMTKKDGIGKGDIQIWSFQAVKTIPAGDGGMITTDSKKIATKIRNMTWLGVEKSTYLRVSKKKYTWDYDIVHSGTKSYMNDINAVLALGNLRRIREILKKRNLIQSIYNLEFKTLPVRIPAYSKTVQYYTLRVSDRDFVSEYLAENDIATSVHFKPLSEMTYWKKAVKNPLPVTDRVWKELLSLPCHDALSAEEQKHIVKTFKNALLASSNNPAGW